MKKLLAFIFSLISYTAFPQIGGRFVYEFLNLTSSPKVAALGGTYISFSDDDLSLAYYNPSLLNDKMNQHVSLSYVDYFAGIQYGYASYASKISNKDNIAFGIQYIDYGTFIAADPTGEITGSFYAAEYALNVVFSHKIDSSFTIGADIRPILSVYEHYQSSGFSTDWGITYHNTRNLYTLALVIRNLGAQIQPYYGSMYEKLPFEIQFGYTQQLRYAPFRFSITAQHLETLDMSVPDYENLDTQSGATQPQSKKTSLSNISDLTMRHLIFGVEFLPFDNFFVRAGYNYQRRQELKIDSHPGTIGFSWGFGLSISTFQLSYGRATYHVAGASNHFSIATDLSTFYHRKQKGYVD
jgi:hypothetical protein